MQQMVTMTMSAVDCGVQYQSCESFKVSLNFFFIFFFTGTGLKLELKLFFRIWTGRDFLSSTTGAGPGNFFLGMGWD